MSANFKLGVIEAISHEKAKNFLHEGYELDATDGLKLTPVTHDSVSGGLVDKLRKWRSENQSGFLKQFKVTNEGTLKWLKHGVLEREDRLLFLVIDKYGEMIGHVGVSSFDFENKTCEIDNVVRGELSKQRQSMYLASLILLDWVRKEINPDDIKLRVFNDNVSALRLYDRIGFKLDQLIGLRKVSGDDYVEWVNSTHDVDRYFISMCLGCR